MEWLNNIIRNFLASVDTDYAIMINGDWGSGKTFYVKNVLSKLINETDFATDKKYAFVYVSLFGLTNSEELSNKIFLQLNPKLKNVVTIGTSLISKAVEFATGVDVKKDLKDLVGLYNIPKEKVLVFDDLERLESRTLNEVLGYINSFTEHNNLKVLIVANEKELIKKFTNSTNDYEQIKEKLVRFTYHFDPNIRQVFSDLIPEKICNLYKGYILTNENFICTLFEKGDHKNLRTLKFVFDVFALVFEEVNKSSELNDEYKKEILAKFLLSFCIYSIEYKKNQKSNQLELLKNLSSYDRLVRKLWETKGEKDAKDKSPEELFVDKIENAYLKSSTISYTYYDWIVPLVHSGIFYKKDLIVSAKEIQNEYVKQKLEPAYIKLSRVRQIMQVENVEVEKVMQDVIEEAKNGSYILYEYPEIFYTIENVLKVTSYSKERIVDDFKEGIIISKGHSSYYYNLNMHYRFGNVSPELKSILQFCIEQNESIKGNNDDEIALKVVQSLQPYDKEKFQEIFSNNETLQNDVFHLINPKIFYDAFIELSNANKFEFYQTFVKISNDYLNSASHKKDISFFSSLKELFDSTIETSVSKQHCVWMSYRLKEVIDRINM